MTQTKPPLEKLGRFIANSLQFFDGPIKCPIGRIVWLFGTSSIKLIIYDDWPFVCEFGKRKKDSWKGSPVSHVQSKEELPKR
jgi:hypothetical protein